MRLDLGMNIFFPKKYFYTLKEILTDPIARWCAKKIILKIVIIGIIIVLLIYFGIYLNKLFEALLVLVTWCQFELAYRQNKLYKASQEPLLSVEVSNTPQGDYNLSIENVSSIPAYSVNIKRYCDKNGKRIPLLLRYQKVESSYISCLKPKEKKVIAKISKEFYNEYLIEGGGFIEISYYNQFHEENILRCYFYTKEMISYAIGGVKKKLSGFLILTLIDDIEEFQELRNLRKYIKEY
jgi:hypothetical protein